MVEWNAINVPEPVPFKAIKMANCFNHGEGPARYRALVAPGYPKPVPIRAIADEMVDAGCNVDRTTIAYVLELFARKLPELIVKSGGRPHQLGELCTFVPEITGTLEAENSRADPAKNKLVIKAISRHFFRLALKNVPLRNIAESPDSVIDMVMRNFNTNTANVYPGTGPLTITGSGLRVYADRPDEGVWLASEADGKETRLVVDKSADQYDIFCHAAERIPDGEYRLVLRTRGRGDASAPLIVIRRRLTVRPFTAKEH